MILEPLISVVSATLELILGRLNLNSPDKQLTAIYLNHVVVGCSMLTLVFNILKMSFGLDPAS